MGSSVGKPVRSDAYIQTELSPFEEAKLFAQKLKNKECPEIEQLKKSILTPAEISKCDKEINKQLETFADDMDKLERGEMTYSEMRSLYG